jgi:acetylglutamate kinase
METLRNKTIVVKYGGSAMTSAQGKRAAAQDAAALQKEGARLVLAHGGGPEIETALRALSIESRFVNGLRRTDRRTMDVVQMTLCGRVNKDLAALITRHGGRAVGVCGMDGGFLQARALGGELGYTGEIEAVDTTFLDDLLRAGLVPVVSSVALNKDALADGTREGEPLGLNINADTAAARIACALKAEKLVMMTDTAGVLRDTTDPASLITRIRVKDAAALKASGVIAGGMLPKIDAALAAAEQGVREVVIIDGRREHALRDALLSGVLHGTTITL